MENINFVELRGRVGSVKTTTVGYDGHALIKFTLATSRALKSDNGDASIETSWHNVVYMSAKSIELVTGMTVHIKGFIRYIKYTSSEGNIVQCPEIVAKDFTIVTD